MAGAALAIRAPCPPSATGCRYVGEEAGKVRESGPSHFGVPLGIAIAALAAWLAICGFAGLLPD